MVFWNVILVAIGLGMDAMSVCMGIGVKWHGRRQIFRMAWHMGLFQFFMPIAGYLLGNTVAALLARWGGYIAAALVMAVGAKMLYEAIRQHPGDVAERAEHAAERARHAEGKDPTRGLSLLVLSVATSIDALVVGFSLGLRGAEIFATSLVIGIVAATMATAGILIGKRIGQKLGRYAEILGAVLLIVLGVSFIWL